MNKRELVRFLHAWRQGNARQPGTYARTGGVQEKENESAGEPGVLTFLSFFVPTRYFLGASAGTETAAVSSAGYTILALS